MTSNILKATEEFLKKEEEKILQEMVDLFDLNQEINDGINDAIYAEIEKYIYDSEPPYKKQRKSIK